MITQERRLLIVDLSALAFLDSGGIHAMVDAQSSVAATGSMLVLACAQPIVARMLTLTGADQLIRVVGTIEEALGAG